MNPSAPIKSGKEALPLPKRCIVYVDGFNLYYGVLEGNPQWKWLDLLGYFGALRPDESIVCVKYFSAIIDPEKHISERRDRQKRYFNALGSLPKVEVILGKYQMRTVRCRATCRQQYQTPEEKKTDVNIAVHMLDDVYRSRVDHIVLVSGDSDMEPAVAWIRRHDPRVKITVYIPVLPGEANTRRNDFYHSIGVTCRNLPLAEMPAHQFPQTVELPNGVRVDRPSDWT